MNANERLKNVRASLNLTLAQFGEKIGITKSAVSDIEHGRNNVSEQVIKAVCREYHVSEAWLRDGSGEMFTRRAVDAEIEAMIEKLDDSPRSIIKKRLLLTMARLDESEWELLASVAEKLAQTADGADGETTDPTPEQLHRQLDEQIEAEKREPEKSEVS
jgi:transcriptional regulator with XRE-family HTH domain